MTKLLEFTDKINLNGYVLLFPSVSVGNVAQLTVDLIISTHDLKKIATLWHPALIPVIGGDPFASDPSEICTACELYASEKLQVATIQLRSGIIKELASEFFNDLNNAISDLQFNKIVILTSSFAHELHNIDSGPFRYIASDKFKNNFDALDILPMESTDAGCHVIFGSGFATKLFDCLSKNRDCATLIKYSSEGDNRPDAVQMLLIVYKLLDNFKHCDIKEIKYPTSWDHVFGNPPPEGLFF